MQTATKNDTIETWKWVLSIYADTSDTLPEKIAFFKKNFTINVSWEEVIEFIESSRIVLPPTVMVFALNNRFEISENNCDCWFQYKAFNYDFNGLCNQCGLGRKY